MKAIGSVPTGVRKTWSHIVPGNFGAGSTTTSLFFYDAAAGEGRFFSTDGNGSIHAIGTVPASLRKTWSRVIPGTFLPG